MNEKQCPYCREWIPQELSFCPYCMESMEAKKKIKSPIRKRRVTLLVLNTLVLVLFILCIWLYCNRGKEPYGDYTGQWNGSTRAIGARTRRRDGTGETDISTFGPCCASAASLGTW